MHADASLEKQFEKVGSVLEELSTERHWSKPAMAQWDALMRMKKKLEEASIVVMTKAPHGTLPCQIRTFFCGISCLTVCVLSIASQNCNSDVVSGVADVYYLWLQTNMRDLDVTTDAAQQVRKKQQQTKKKQARIRTWTGISSGLGAAVVASAADWLMRNCRDKSETPAAGEVISLCFALRCGDFNCGVLTKG
jgi:hypothetical protein